MSDSDREVISALVAGRLPSTLPDGCEFGAELRALVALLSDVRALAMSLGRGDLGLPVVNSGGPVVTSLKALNRSLRHLTWQAQRVAQGDLSHRVDFMGEFADAFNDIVRQLSDRRNLESELLQAEKARLLGHIARSVAHEINTPAQFTSDSIAFITDAFTELIGLVAVYRDAVAELTADGRHADVLQKVRDAEQASDLEFVSEEAGQACVTARDGIRRVADIIRALEDFIGSDHPDKATADINRAVLATATVARYRCQKVAIVETDLGEVPPIQCSVGELNEAFLALILNAADAIADVAGKSGTLGRITIRTRAVQDAVQVEIADTGGGIPTELQLRVFEPSFTTRDPRRWTGQGLPMARSVFVEGHGGTLTFESQPGGGTTFRITLPAGPTDAAVQ